MLQQQRTNIATALIVEQGIERDQLYGSVLAWKFMAGHGVPDELIARVLAYPAQRRQGYSRPSSNDAANAPLTTAD